MKRCELQRAGESGFSLALLITFVTVMSVFLSVAVPVYTTQAQRELEEELIFRGEEYVRAIQKYQRQFGVYPPDLDALLESNEMRFLRREYLDPITGEGFRLIKANPDGTLEGSRIYEFDDLPLLSGPLSSGARVGGTPASGDGGFFGTGGAGGGPGGTGDSPFASGGGFGGGGFGGQTGGSALPGFGEPSLGRQDNPAGQGGFGGLSQLTGGGIPGFGQPSGPPQGQQGGRGSGGTPQGAGGAGGFGGFGGESGGGGRGGGSTRDGFGGTLAGDLIVGGRGGGAPSSGQSGFGGGIGSTGQAAAISGIVGVAPNNEAFALKVYNEREIYAEWEFIALPTTLPGVGQSPGLMPGDENNSGQPSTVQSNSSPFGSSPITFGQ